MIAGLHSMFLGQVMQGAMRTCVIILVAWFGMLPSPAHASWSARLPEAAPGDVFERTKDQLMAPFPKVFRPIEPDPYTPVAEYLPDLGTLPPFDLRLQLLPGGRRFLRLSNTIWNSGQGPLELINEFDPDKKLTMVYQHVLRENDERRKKLVGEFVWHPAHDHWHFEQFTLYELWSLQPDHSLGEVVASSDKLSYCVMDTDVVDWEHPKFAPRRSYVGCNQLSQGLSVGWGDTYFSYLDGQTLDLTGLPDGFYALVSTVNPNGAILEEDYRNNAAWVFIALRNHRVAQVTLKEIKMAGCDATLCE